MTPRAAHVIVVWAVATSAYVCAADEVAKLYDADTATFRKQLAELAGWCRERGLVDEAKLAEAWHTPTPPEKQRYFLLSPDGVERPARTQQAEFVARLTKLRNERGERLFALAKQAADAGQFSFAVRLVYETLREAPRHAAARKILGYSELDGVWLTPYEAAKHRAAQRWHPKYGWIARDHLVRYEAGERYLNGKWVSADDDARIHATIERGWEVQTENFRIRTNHSLEEGVRLAERLEKMLQTWRQMFARYHTAEAEWRRLFAGGAPREFNHKRYPIVYYRTREEYLAALKRREPRIEQTSGIFLVDDDTAYFYADATERNDEFLFHEVTHQLFALTRPTTLRVGSKGNFWIVEGIACYLESLTLGDDAAEVGGVDTPRMLAARVRLLRDGFYVPLAEFTKLSMSAMQRDSRIATLYSQASGLATFLMHAAGGRYREATVDYLFAVYAGRDTPTTLSERAGRGYDELDREYRAYVEGLGPLNVEPAGPTPGDR